MNVYEDHPLHSNMFLLIQVFSDLPTDAETAFTFQYVSINTQYDDDQTGREYSLHSNMFLLIQKEVDKLLRQYLLYIPICFY